MGSFRLSTSKCTSSKPVMPASIFWPILTGPTPWGVPAKCTHWYWYKTLQTLCMFVQFKQAFCKWNSGEFFFCFQEAAYYSFNIPVRMTSPSTSVMIELIWLIKYGILKIISLVEPFCRVSPSTWLIRFKIIMKFCKYGYKWMSMCIQRVR